MKRPTREAPDHGRYAIRATFTGEAPHYAVVDHHTTPPRIVATYAALDAAISQATRLNAGESEKPQP